MRLADTAKSWSLLFIWSIRYVLILSNTTVATTKSYYTINAPGVLKSNQIYSVAVTLHESDGPCSLRVGIEGPEFKESKDVSLQPFESQIVKFLPKKLESEGYILKAVDLHGENFKHLSQPQVLPKYIGIERTQVKESKDVKLQQFVAQTKDLNSFNFKHQSMLHVLTKYGPKVYIQTDKAVYKPQDIIRFRVVVLDEHTRPLNIEDPMRVEILDGGHNRIKQFRNIFLTEGVFTGKFQLSKYPTLGDWKINFTIDGSYDYSSFKMIQVQNYVLPKFSVYIKTPSDVILKDGYINVVFYGKYTFKRYVEGVATIELWNHQYEMLLATKNTTIENIGNVDFKLTSIANINKYFGILIKVKITEKYTGHTEHMQQFVNIRTERYSLVVLDDEIEFENNKPYSIKVYVKHWTGSPVLDHKTPVTMQHGGKMYLSHLDASGAATFDFEYVSSSDYKFQFKDSKLLYPSIYTYENFDLNNREYYCRLKLLDKRLRLGKPVLIEVSSIVTIPYLMYIIIGHGSIIKTEYIKVPPNQKSHTINITASIEMIPESFIYVHYIHKGVLRYEEMRLNFPNEFENQISISAPSEVSPGEEVTITVNAQPNSYVGILAIDLGVNLLNDTYDLNKQEILEDLRRDKSYSDILAVGGPGIISGLVTLTKGHADIGSGYQVTAFSDGFQTDDPTDKPITTELVPKMNSFRQDFPETWIFNNYIINETETKLTLQIPDSITTWRITAFSSNAVTGFGMVDKHTDITVSPTFFISLNLPYSIKRGEIVTIPITIFNYSNQTLDTEVIFYNYDKDFSFIKSNIQKVEKSKNEELQIKHIFVAAGRGKIVKYLIYPLKSGEISIRVTATSSLHIDTVLQKLKVEPEGIPKQQNQATYLSIPAGEKISSTFQIEQPMNIVLDSEYITFTVGGHYLVPTVEHFQDLIQMPTGSGEQNMINFAPSVLIQQYLKVNDRLSKHKALVESLQSAMEVGYQQQLSFRHENGGYSVFGMGTDEEPNTWLTAYVVRYFIKASQFVDIEKQIIDADLEYLARQQKSNGEFLFTGYLLKPNHKNEYGLTAFILLAFLEDEKYANKYQETIQNGVKFLNSNINNINDINALCLTATILKKAERDGADILLDRLKLLGKERNGLKWWSEDDNNLANDIEITANAALTLLDTAGDHTSILQWLIEQRNANGGFISSYDTVAGMEALVKFSEKYKNLQHVNLNISYSAIDEQGKEVASAEFYVDSKNVLNLQTHELPNSTRHVTFEIQGIGASLVQLNQQYNVNHMQGFRYFNIQPNLIYQNAKEYILQLEFTYKSDTNTGHDATNMIISEVNLPSGFLYQVDNNILLRLSNIVQRVELKNSGSIVVLYLNKLETDIKYNLFIPLVKDNVILMPKPAAIVMYDAYNLSRSSVEFYTAANIVKLT